MMSDERRHHFPDIRKDIAASLMLCELVEDQKLLHRIQADVLHRGIGEPMTDDELGRYRALREKAAKQFKQFIDQFGGDDDAIEAAIAKNGLSPVFTDDTEEFRKEKILRFREQGGGWPTFWPNGDRR
jgi:hypothetical protein